MKKLLFAFAFVLISTLSYSQELTYSKNYNGDTFAKDQYGDIVANGSKNYNGDFVWKDQYGNVIKTESRNYNRDLVYYPNEY
ncbi:hypothetical protein OO010_07480 [Flavobacteriaceae bacterium KMM 6898]|nr:hypothetical protein [Flavobacteriaceae bacterium KMM 6898]